jgi:hypothetical protein
MTERIPRRHWPANIDLTPQTLIEFVERRGSVSFVEIEDYFGDQAKGDGIWGIGNLVLWVNMSDKLVDALNDKQVREALIMKPAHWMVYAHDGRIPSLPLVKIGDARRCATGKTKKRYWAPVCFDKRKPNEKISYPQTNSTDATGFGSHW